MSIVSVLLFLTCALVLRVCSACGHDSEGGHGMPRWLVRRRKRLDKGARKGSDGKAHRSHKVTTSRLCCPMPHLHHCTCVRVCSALAALASTRKASWEYDIRTLQERQ